MGATVRRGALLARNTLRDWRRERGEQGWGPPPPPPLVLHRKRPARVAIVGAGVQGRVAGRAVGMITGAEIAGIADLRPDQLAAAGDELGVDPNDRHGEVAALLDRGPIDLAFIATTAPSHCRLAAEAVAAGAARVLVEKPIDTSWERAADLIEQCRRAEVPLGVGYHRRWSPDHRAMSDAIRDGAIGPVRRVHAVVGAGELAMHASHFVDLTRILTGQEVTTVEARLAATGQANQRGVRFQDPTGVVTLALAQGARAVIDVERDVPRNTAVVLVVGDSGTILIEESAGHWTIRGESSRSWLRPFVAPWRPVPNTARVVHAMLTGRVPACDGGDGLAALEIILAAHASASAERPVSLPLPPDQRDLRAEFP